MSQRGYTLIEMAMVFVLVGLLVGGGLFALAPIIDKARINQTNTTLDQVEASLELFVIRNSRLPCPADGSLSNTSTNYGLEQPSGGGTCTITGANAVIPWKTMGMDEAYSLDGWATRLSEARRPSRRGRS
jgi:prepilin-type N-terminal cleavage/methylation domain-containing protein